MAEALNNNYVDNETLQSNAERKQKLKILLEKGGEISEYFKKYNLIKKDNFKSEA